MKYDKKIKRYNYDENIANINSLKRLIEIIFNTYNIYNNNYYNSVNINNLLLYYIKSDYINNKIVKIKLKDKYEEISDIIKQKKIGDKKLKEDKENNEKIEKIK